MPILDNLFGPKLDNLQNALGRASQRHTMLSNNLANVNTPGYKRQDIDFNITLKEEMEKSDIQPLGQQQSGGAMRLDGNGVDLEKEVMGMAETELRYQALTDMTADYFSGLKSAIREGK